MQNAMIPGADRDRRNGSCALDSVARDKSFPVIRERGIARREIYIPVPGRRSLSPVEFVVLMGKW